MKKTDNTEQPVIHPDTINAVNSFETPEALGFGQTMAPILYRADYENGHWGSGELRPYGDLCLDPGAKVLHFAQVVFEGLKAYRVEQDKAAIFRPLMNWARLNRSAARMLMPELPENLFMDGLCAVTAYAESLIPRNSGQSLYLRPLLFASEPGLGLTIPDRHTFLVIASPSDAIAAGSLRVIIERDSVRAVPGGTGDVKVSGNYGASLLSTMTAAERGFNQPLWLDAAEHRFIEELSVMNFFAVIDGELHTPELTGTILPGVTRDSVLNLACESGLAVRECRLEIDSLLNRIRTGRCTEAFACGTAVIIAPISVIGEKDGTLYELPQSPGPVTKKLRQGLLDIQEGRVADKYSWLYSIPKRFYP